MVLARPRDARSCTLPAAKFRDITLHYSPAAFTIIEAVTTQHDALTRTNTRHTAPHPIRLSPLHPLNHHSSTTCITSAHQRPHPPPRPRRHLYPVHLSRPLPRLTRNNMHIPPSTYTVTVRPPWVPLGRRHTIRSRQWRDGV